jgi:hypothetical protein
VRGSRGGREACRRTCPQGLAPIPVLLGLTILAAGLRIGFPASSPERLDLHHRPLFSALA